VLIASLGVNGALLLPLPIVLATISALVAFAGLARSDAMSVPAIGAMALALVASYLGGAVLVGSLQGLPVGTSPLPIAGQVALLATFLFSWFWQAARLPLPATLYIRLLNTGGPALIR
jgi:lysozyme family protein